MDTGEDYTYQGLLDQIRHTIEFGPYNPRRTASFGSHVAAEEVERRYTRLYTYLGRLLHANPSLYGLCELLREGYRDTFQPVPPILSNEEYYQILLYLLQ